jgi:serine protein kinase
MDSAETLIAQYAREYQKRQESEMPLASYLEACRDDPMMFATAAERLVAAIGEPRILDTAKDERLGRIFLNRTIKIYPAFEDFYGMEETVERIVGFFATRRRGWRSINRFSTCWARWAEASPRSRNDSNP